MIKLITAVDATNAIGNADGSLPWQLSHDLAIFKQKTLGSTVLMGRKTFESLNRPAGLPGRTNIVLSSSQTRFTEIQGVKFARGFDQLPAVDGDLWIIGGAAVYAQVLDRGIVDELHVTEVHTNSGASVHFPVQLYNTQEFVANQAKLGIIWVLTNIHQPTVSHIGITIKVYKRDRRGIPVL